MTNSLDNLNALLADVIVDDETALQALQQIEMLYTEVEEQVEREIVDMGRLWPYFRDEFKFCFIGAIRFLLKEIDGPLTDTQADRLDILADAGKTALQGFNMVADLGKIQVGKLDLFMAESSWDNIVSVGHPSQKFKFNLTANLKTPITDEFRVKQIIYQMLNIISTDDLTDEIVVSIYPISDTHFAIEGQVPPNDDNNEILKNYHSIPELSAIYQQSLFQGNYAPLHFLYHLSHALQGHFTISKLETGALNLVVNLPFEPTPTT